MRVISRVGRIGYLKEAGSDLNRVSGPEPEPNRGQDLYRGRTDGEQSRRRRRTWTKQTLTATAHMKITDPATIAYADKGYSSRASVRVRSFTFVSLSSCSVSCFRFHDLFSSLYYTLCCIVVCAFAALFPLHSFTNPSSLHIPPSQSSLRLIPCYHRPGRY